MLLSIILFSRWDLSAVDLLPEYMKLCYRALLDAYSEFEKDLASKGILYGLPFAKESVSSFQLL